MAKTGTGQETQPTSWDNAPILEGMAASQQGGSRGAQIWGVDQNYSLVSDFQITPGGSWSGWSSEDWANAPQQVIELTTCQQNNGCVQLWVIDDEQQLWSIS